MRFRIPQDSDRNGERILFDGDISSASVHRLFFEKDAMFVILVREACSVL